MGFLSGGGPDLFEAISAKELVQLFKEEGYSAETATTSSGKPYVQFKVEGLTSAIYPYDEVETRPGHYSSIQFSAVFNDKITIDMANRWNCDRRFVKVYSDSDGDLQIELDVWLRGGVTKRYVLERIADWRRLLPRVLHFLFNNED